MIVTFISQCEKNALKKTRRVLDAFADRIGDNTWQTVITQEGLNAVRKLLRKTASKSTAVSCHQVKTRSRTELLWVVGRKDAFDHVGRVPVNTTQVNRTLRDDTADWIYLPVIQALTALAALLHDWGKANNRFQQKLTAETSGLQGDALRHEYISCLLILALFESENDKTDKQWLTALANGDFPEGKQPVNSGESDTPFKELPLIAQLVSWLVLSHHRLPLNTDATASCAETEEDIFSLLDKSWGYFIQSAEHTWAQCLTFDCGVLANANLWRKPLKRWANKLLELEPQIQHLQQQGCLRLVLHHCRLNLMLADHSYSSQQIDKPWHGQTELVANTRSRKKKNGGFQRSHLPNQYLDQHLLGVCDYAKDNVRAMPLVEKHLPVSKATQLLKKRSPQGFDWQDKAVQKIKHWQTAELDSKKQGFFAVNMASTGCGKTFANAKVMRCLSADGDSLRYTLALGLRTLTLQTGDEYRDKIFSEKDNADLAVLIGSRAIQELHQEDPTKEDNLAQQSGSESAQSLLSDSDHVAYDGETAAGHWSTILTTDKARSLLHAPVLACTIDHLMPAVTTKRGGRYILPALRLMSSDLVIDEIDDFTGEDSIAIGWLIHLAGMLGRKVMISSATIPPAMAQGYFRAYRLGWQQFARTRNKSEKVGCAWIDEFDTQVKSVYAQNELSLLTQYEQYHQKYITRRTSRLAQQPARRKATILSCDHLINQTTIATHEAEQKKNGYFQAILAEAIQLHQRHHYQDENNSLTISFGVIRMANINPTLALTRYLLECELPDDVCIRVMPYHSQQVLLLRNEQEQHLDQVLKRKEGFGNVPDAFNNSVIQQHIQAAHQRQKKHLIFILVATPVEEVGRDHDFDWAIIEPSSFRSMVQMAGRVMRHRKWVVESSNIAILQYNWQTLKADNKPGVYFTRPGYEDKKKKSIPKSSKGRGKSLCFFDHDVQKIVDIQTIAERFDATDRIDSKNEKNQFARLEHAAIDHDLCSGNSMKAKALHGYLTQHWYFTALCQHEVSFRRSEPRIQLFLLFSELETFTASDEPFFGEKDEKDEEGKAIRAGSEIANRENHHGIHRIQLSEQQTERLWLQRDYVQLIEDQAERRNIPAYYACLRYGEINMREPQETQQTHWLYNDQLGLFKEL